MRLRLSVVLVSLTLALSLCAAIPAGSWKVHPAFSYPAAQVVETGEKVYFLAGGGLFSYDKAYEETFAYTVDNSLSDYIIDAVYPHPQDEFLVICYSTGNIDLLYPDGSVCNLSDIKDASATLSKSINDVAVQGSKIYVATNFGVVIFDSASRKVIDSGNYNTPVTGIAAASGKIAISVGDDLLVIDSNSRINRLENWNVAASPGSFIELAADKDGFIIGRNLSRVIKMTVEGNRVTEIKDIGESNQHFLLSGGNVRYCNGVYVGENQMLSYLPEAARQKIIGGINPEQNIWALDEDGIASYMRSGNEWACIKEKYRPYSMSIREATFIISSVSGERIYFTCLGPTNYRKTASTANEGIFTVQATTMMDVNGIYDVRARDVSAGTVASEFPPAASGCAAATTRLAENPFDSNVYYIGTGNDGLYKIVDGKYAGRYDSSNSPMGTPWGSRVYEVSFDRSGNMWVGTDGITSTQSAIVLPASKLGLSPEDVTKNDWVIPYIDGFKNQKDIRIFHCRKSDMIFIFSYNTEQNFVAYHTNGTPDNFNDDRALTWSELSDTDGKSFKPYYITAIAEDNDGKVWMGTTEGVFEISSPNEAINPSMKVRRLKIDHGDGTGLADYFAGTDVVLDICVDGANRKWVATQSSGVYLLNDYGNEIVRHFTSDNSPLPDQRVNAVYADVLSNSVFFATPGGVIEYGGDAMVPSDSFSSVRVYPNPVTPEYGGIVTVDGLMDGSLVKIADSSGAVVWQGRAEGGMITWNIENSAGRRVRSGVYYVLASSNAGGSSKGAVAKIMVIN